MRGIDSRRTRSSRRDEASALVGGPRGVGGHGGDDIRWDTAMSVRSREKRVKSAMSSRACSNRLRCGVILWPAISTMPGQRIGPRCLRRWGRSRAGATGWFCVAGRRRRERWVPARTTCAAADAFNFGMSRRPAGSRLLVDRLGYFYRALLIASLFSLRLHDSPDGCPGGCDPVLHPLRSTAVARPLRGCVRETRVVDKLIGGFGIVIDSVRVGVFWPARWSAGRPINSRLSATMSTALGAGHVLCRR